MFRLALHRLAALAALSLVFGAAGAQVVPQTATPQTHPNARPGSIVVPGSDAPQAGFETQRLAVEIEGAGAVRMRPGNFSCATRCERSVRKGQTVTLSAQTGETERFVGWEGACSGTLPRCEITLDADTRVKARFSGVNVADRPKPAAAEHGPDPETPIGESVTAEVRVAVTGAGTVRSEPRGMNCRPNCRRTVPRDQPFVLLAIPTPESRFVEWRGGCTGSTPRCTVRPKDDVQVTAVFEARR